MKKKLNILASKINLEKLKIMERILRKLGKKETS
jgi:hypothetical protein